jgi:hypothetical protein
MKKIALFLCSACLVGAAFAQSAGAGISVFVPESLYRFGNGTIAFEQGLSTSIGFGPILSVPIGFAYHSTDGYLLEHADAASVEAPAFYGDSIVPYAALKARASLGSAFYLEAMGGGALNYAFSMKPTADFAKALAASATQRIALDEVSIEKKIGYGFIAGAAFGVKLGKLSVDLGATYRWLTTPVTIEADIRRVDGTAAASDRVVLENASAILRGISFRLGGDFALK